MCPLRGFTNGSLWPHRFSESANVPALSKRRRVTALPNAPNAAQSASNLCQKMLSVFFLNAQPSIINQKIL
jgi:hypothetical protein